MQCTEKVVPFEFAYQDFLQRQVVTAKCTMRTLALPAGTVEADKNDRELVHIRLPSAVNKSIPMKSPFAGKKAALARLDPAAKEMASAKKQWQFAEHLWK